MKVLIETRMNSLRLNESKAPRKGCLGRLEGVCADFKNPTRNGRLYPKGLWEKVFANELFKEALESKTAFGELDHPEDRFEPLMSESCIVMTDYRIDEDAGLIYGGFDILDTPKGKILKSIVDYGSVVGVSSRGQGDIVETADGEVVSEDTYEFACFDVVSTPAVEKARQTVAESIKRVTTETFTESVKRQIKEAQTIADLNIIRSVVRSSSLNDSDIDSIVESIEDKCKKLQDGVDTILPKSKVKESVNSTNSAKTIRENKKLYECIADLKSKISAYKHREQRYVESLQSKSSTISSLQDEIKSLKLSAKRDTSCVKSVKESFTKKLSDSDNKLKVLMSENDKMRNDFKNVKISLSESNSKLRKSESLVSSKESEIKGLNEKLKNAQRMIEQLEAKNEKLSETHSSEIASIDSEVEQYSALLNEAQAKLKSNQETITSLNEKLNKTISDFEYVKKQKDSLSASLKKYQESYVGRVSNVNGINPNALKSSITESTSPQQVDALVEKMRSDIDRYSKLGITKNGFSTGDSVKAEIQTRMSQELKEELIEEDNLKSFLRETLKSM